MDPKFLSPYKPEDTEDRIYKLWEDSGFFNPDICIKEGVASANAPTFSIVLPPPNVTGVLHMGHALMISWQDAIVRYHRMQGKRTLWVPGTDHAAIATQAKVEKEISKKEGKSRYDIGRAELLKRIDLFAKESHDTITMQVKKMGASLDWSREAFTLDEKRNLAVRTIFKRMYDDGLIYRGHRIVNWDPRGQTTISDDEIVYEERTAKMYTFRYSKDFPFPISTTRPETKLGDTAVAVHPDDERYKQYIGKEYDAEFCGVHIHLKVIADQAVEKEFGTGALGVTPAHSMTDWDMAERHNLPKIQVINEKARMIVGGDALNGKKTTEAREVVVEWLRKEGLLIKEEDVNQRVGTAERTGGVVEPLPKLQWFIAVNKEFTPSSAQTNEKTTLKELMRKGVEAGEINIIPDHFSKTYFHWIDNLRDWCISRQIWYGHRVPVWYKGDEIYCGIEAPEGDGWTEDEDTLDTWFSSGLWTFSTLGWPEQTDDLAHFHPTALIQPGTEILFFWVARMILMTEYALGTVPFRTVLLNGMVRDSQGRKFSKSLGNGGDPMESAKKYGADAIRFYFYITATPGTDTKLYEDKLLGYKKYANKIWNIARFILSSTEGVDVVRDKPELTSTHQGLIDEFHTLATFVGKHIEEYKLHLAAERLYHYTWNEVADVIIESQKATLLGPDCAEKTSAQWTLRYILENLMKLHHPFMPFISEEIWGLLPPAKESDGSVIARKPLIITAWPNKGA